MSRKPEPPRLRKHANEIWYIEWRGDGRNRQKSTGTSDLKRGPIERTIRQYLKKTGHCGLVVNCMGLRAEESSARARKVAFKYNERNSKAGREWYDWLPIFDLTEPKVFAKIHSANQKPHWAYQAGMSRLSCCFCIMSSREDLKTASRLMPDLHQRYVAKEREIDHTFVMPSKGVRKFLPEITELNVRGMA